jgi:hypothetical protein
MNQFRTSAVLALLLTVLASVAHADTLNLRELGAVGDGEADDTAAVQKAIGMLKKPEYGKLVVPAGAYRITGTLTSKLVGGVVIEGEGKKSILFWDGEAGGTMWRSFGMLHTVFRDLWFRGVPPQSKDPEGRAGILFQARSVRGGNMNNRFESMLFTHAEVGVQMGGDNRQEMCNADYSFANIHASRLGTFLRVRNDQGVDFLVNKLFGVGCGTIFDFQRGGNLTANNVQLTKCSLYLNIEGGGRNAGTFVTTNLRHEHPKSYAKGRDQILKATDIRWEQAVVKFIGFQDSQWSWFRRGSEKRWKPLCEIGAGVSVSFESSIFNGPLARISGEEGKPGSLMVRESTFGFILPHQAIEAGGHGYFQVRNCFSDHMVPLPNMVKWPERPTMKVKADGTFEHREVPPVIKGAGEAMEALKEQRAEWIEYLEKRDER